MSYGIQDTIADLVEHDADAEELKLKIATAQSDMDNLSSGLMISGWRIAITKEGNCEEEIIGQGAGIISESWAAL